ncbi:DNA ligase (ATP) [Actinomortierella ambigua]|uniref:DNA ligase n=1 Tax=Actinomortierella ambigua TaxID=1343610 RepID=A0A9P6U9F4_9FUNG|nr:DNA ligase (ATP) [Actinomortierella ambigua]
MVMASSSSSARHEVMSTTAERGGASSMQDARNPTIATTTTTSGGDENIPDDPQLPTRQFYKFCLLLESLDKKRKNINKGQQLGEFFKLDRQRGNYSLKEQKLGAAYIEALGLPHTSFNALKLERWKKKHDGQADELAGDFSLVAWDVISKYAPGEVPEVHTISEVNSLLSELAASNRDIPTRKRIFQTLVKHYTALENKWVIRMILKGVSENTVFPIYHPDALDYYNVCSNLKKTVDDCADENIRLTTSDIRLNQPFKPMLSKRVNNFKEVIECMGGREFWIETKLDGERVQLHKEGDQYRYWSRKGNEYTHLYGAHPQEGSLTPYLHPLINPLATSLILDGEMVEYDPATDTILPFGTVKTAGGDHSGDANKTRPCLVVFDILYMNGVSILDQQLQLRWDMFDRLIPKPERGRLEVLTHRVGSREQDVIDAIDEAVLGREEGVILKNPQSRYLCNGRNKDWIKVKPEYVDNMAEELDLIIIGAKYGAGARGNGVLATFLCAIRDDTVQPDADGNPQFLSFCRFGSGTSYGIIDELNTLFRDHGLENTVRNHQTQFPWVKWKSIAKVCPDYIIDPRKSRVVQIKASEIVISDSYEAEYTLRFPRFERFRPDKDYMSCMTKSQLFQLRRTMGGKLWNNARKQSALAAGGIAAASGGLGGTGGSRQGRTRPSGVRKTTQPYFLPSRVGTDTSKVQRVDDLFHGLMFFVLRGDAWHGSKQDLETEIKRYGGAYSQSPRHANVLIAGAEGPENALEGLKTCGDILLPSWVQDCIREKRVLSLAPKYMLFTTEATKAKFRESMDPFEDSYTEPLTLDALQEILDKMPNRSKVLQRRHMRFIKSEPGVGQGPIKTEPRTGQVASSSVMSGGRRPWKRVKQEAGEEVKEQEQEGEEGEQVYEDGEKKRGGGEGEEGVDAAAAVAVDEDQEHEEQRRRDEWERALRIAESLGRRYGLFEDEEEAHERDDQRVLGMFSGMKVVVVYPPWPMAYFLSRLAHRPSFLGRQQQQQDEGEGGGGGGDKREEELTRMAVKDSLPLVLDLWQHDQQVIPSAFEATRLRSRGRKKRTREGEKEEEESSDEQDEADDGTLAAERAETELAIVVQTMVQYEDIRQRLDLIKTVLEYHGAWVMTVTGDGSGTLAERHLIMQELTMHNRRWGDDDDDDNDDNDDNDSDSHGSDKEDEEEEVKEEKEKVLREKRKKREQRCPISHFVFHPDYLDALAWWNSSRKGVKRVPHIVTTEWVAASHTEGYRQPEERKKKGP